MRLDYTVEELNGKTVKELIKVAGEYGVTGRWEMKKSELISEIMGAIALESERQLEIVDVTEDVEEIAETNSSLPAFNCKCYDNERFESEHLRDIVDGLCVGDFVAFRRLVKYEDGLYVRMETAKVSEIFDDEVILDTKIGNQYLIKKKGLLWVRYANARTKKWPNFIFKELKGEPKKYDPKSDAIVGRKVYR